MKKASLCIFLFVSCSIAQPQWRQVFNADSGAFITAIKILRPLGSTIHPSITIWQGTTTYWKGDFCLRYVPASNKISLVGADSCTPFNYQPQDWDTPGPKCIYTIWESDAPYDTSRHLISSVNQTTSVWYNPPHYDIYFSNSLNLYLQGNAVYDSCNIKNTYIGDPNGAEFLYPQNAYTTQTIFFHPTDGTILFALTDSGLAEDHFNTCPEDLSKWQLIKRDSSPNFFYIAQDDPQTMFLNAQDTLWHSSDGGLTWSISATATIGAMTHVPHTSIYAAASADSLSAGLYVSANGGKSFLRISPVPSFSLDADQTSGKLYAGTKGAILQFSINEPISVFDSIPGGGNVIGIAAIDGKIIYADSGGVYETDAPNTVQEPIAPNGTLTIENYPDPFSSTTTLKLNGSGKVSSVKIYDMLGREVADLSNQISGNEVLVDGSNLHAGIYICWVQSGNSVSRTRMTVLK
jgi:hypothetical protein